MRNRRVFAIIFITTVILAAAVVAYAYITSPQSLTGGVPEPFTDGWLLPGGQEAALPGGIGADGAGADGAGTDDGIVLTRELPDTLPEDAVLLLKTNYVFVTATVGGSEVFSWTDEDRAPFGHSYGLSCYFIHIPASAAGQTLELRLTPSGQGTAHVYGMTLGGALASAALLINQNLYTITLFFILLCAFIVFTMLVVILRKRVTGRSSTGYLYLSAFMAVSAVWILSDCNVMLLLTRSVASVYYCAGLSFMLLSAPLLLYVRRFLGRGGAALGAVAFLVILNFAVNVVLLVSGLVSASQTLIVTHILHIAAGVLIIALCAWEYIRTKKRQTVEVFVGIGLLVLMSLLGFARYYITGNPDSTLFFVTGLTAFVLTLCVGALRLGASEMIKSKSFENLTALIPSGICKFDNFESANILYANEFFYRMFGYTERQAKEAGFTTAWFTVLPEDLRPMRENIKKYFILSLDRFETEARHMTRGGDIIWVLSRYRLNPKKRGEITAVMIEITDRKRVEEQLRVREEEYRIATRHSNKMILRFDVATRTCYRQPGAMPDFGLPQTIENFPEMIMGSDLVAHDSVAAIRTLFDSIYKGEAEGSIIVSMRDRESEEYRWYHFDFTSIFDNRGKPLQAIISYYDITVQRQKELAFQRWQQSYNSKPKSATNYFEYNLTDDAFEREEGEMLPAVPSDVPRRLSEMAEYIANHHIYPDDINTWLEFMSRDRLLDRYAGSHNAEKTDFRRLSGQDPLWTTVSVQLIPDPYSSDVKAYFLLEDIDDRKQAELYLQERSMRDSLTGLLNRGSFIEAFNDILRKSDLETQHALIMLDIDNFKSINDTLGHSAGDALLVSIANKLKYALRTDDLCGRLGGDEFVICLKHMNLGKPLETRVNDLCNLICDEEIWGVPVSASFGIAGFPYDGLTFDELYKKADVALYTAKAQGRGCFALYDPQLSFDDIQSPEKKTGS